MFNGPNYSSYTDTELFEAYDSIDRESYPERFKQICGVMESRALLVQKGGVFELTEKAEEALNPTTPIKQKEPTYTCFPPDPQYDDNGDYVPNEIPLKKRMFNSLFSLAIIFYGGYGLYINELWVPIAKRTAVVLSGVSAVLMFAAIVCASVMLIAEVIDHYDKRDNEHTYYKVALYFKYVAYSGFAFAVFIGLMTGARIE